MIDDVREIVKRAERDLKVSKSPLELGYYAESAFFSQQAVEKFLKAYILYKKGEPPFTHSIRYLVEVALKFDEDFKTLLDIKASKLSKYYTGTRYLPLLDVSEGEAKEAVGIAKKVREFILRKL